MLDKHDREEIYNELDQLWPGRTPVTKKEFSNWMYALKDFPKRTVISALNMAKREREQISRPPIKAVKHFCHEVEKQAGPKLKEICPWCENRWCLQVVVYIAPWREREEKNIPHRFTRVTPKRDNLYLVVPDVARVHKITRHELSVYCGMCAPSIGAMAYRDFHKGYNGYYEFGNYQSAGTGERLLLKEPPPHEERRQPTEWRQSWERGEFELTDYEAEFLKKGPKSLSGVIKSIDVD